MRSTAAGLAMMALISLGLLEGCTSKAKQSPEAAPTAQGQAKGPAGQLALDMPALPNVAAGSPVQFVLTPVSGTGAPITITNPYTQGALATLSNLPAGTYNLLIQVLDANNAPVWSGSTTVTVVSGQATPASVTLAPVPSAQGTGSVAVTLQVSQPATQPAVVWGDENGTTTVPATATTTVTDTATAVATDPQATLDTLLNPPQLATCKAQSLLYNRVTQACYQAQTATTYTCDDAGVINEFKSLGIDITLPLQQVEAQGFRLDQCGLLNNEPLVVLVASTTVGEQVSLQIKTFCKAGSAACN